MSLTLIFLLIINFAIIYRILYLLDKKVEICKTKSEKADTLIVEPVKQKKTKPGKTNA